jgi:DNA-binding SARP family transcriptional activator
MVILALATAQVVRSATGAVMKWKLLGPVEVCLDDRQVRLTRPRQRAVLACLLLNANRVVHTDHLVDALWAHAPPPTARVQVQAGVSGLRRALAIGAQDGTLVSEAGGYRIVVADGELDHAEFVRCTETAQSYAAAGRSEEAADLLRSALGLWRGAPLGGANGAFVAGAVAALEEQRLAAHEDLADIELSLGRHTRLVVELSTLVGANPLRERLVAQLVVALAGAGQQAQALQVYEEAKLRLADELGLEPGPRLTAAQLSVLRQQVPTSSATTSSAVPVAVGAGRPRPAQLLPDPTLFVGRADQLRELDRVLLADSGCPRAVVLAGAAGAGKTALALRWAHRSLDRFPDGQLHLDLGGRAGDGCLDPTLALGMLLRSLGVPADQVPTGRAEAGNLYRSLLAGRRLLLMFEDAESADQVRPLLPGAASCAVLITSRDRLTGLVAREGAHPMSVGTLAPEEAQALLTSLLGEQRLAGEPAGTVDALAGACAYLPLALRVAAATLIGQPRRSVGGKVAELRRGDALAALAIDDAERSLIEAAFDRSYQALPKPARWLFRCLGLMPADRFTVKTAAGMVGVSPRVVRRLLEDLVNAQLIREDAAGLFHIHRLYRLYARKRLGQSRPAGTTDVPGGRRLRVVPRRPRPPWDLRAAG